jgi:hypothetical protein
MASDVPVGRPQVEYSKESDRWRVRAGELRCQLVADPSEPVELDMPIVAIDGRYFTVAELSKLLAGQGSWGVRIVFASEDELST